MPTTKTRRDRKASRRTTPWTTAWLAALLASAISCSKTGDGNASAGAGGDSPAASAFKGKTVTVAIPEGAVVADYVRAQSAAWAEDRKATATVVQVPESELFAGITAGKNVGDIVVYPPAWAGETMAKERLVALREADLQSLEWDDVLPVYRERLGSWLGTPYGVPLDGEILVLYYRLDLFKDKDRQAKYLEKTGKRLTPPRTWTDYRAVAEFFNGEDFDADGKPDYGTVEPGTGDGMGARVFVARAASYALRRNDPALFFHPESMDAAVSEPSFVRALEDAIAMQASGAPGMAAFGAREVRAEFLAGRSALALDGCDLATLTQDATASASKVRNLVGFSIVPGSNRVFEAESSTWSESKITNFAPYLGAAGILASVTKTAAAPDAAFDLLVHLGGKDATLEAAAAVASPLTPFRTWHMSRVSDWLKTGFSGDSARDYLGVVQASLRHANAASDLRIAGAGRYWAALERGYARALSGAEAPEAALSAVAAEWNKITDDLGREAQLKSYRDSLGLPPD